MHRSSNSRRNLFRLTLVTDDLLWLAFLSIISVILGEASILKRKSTKSMTKIGGENSSIVESGVFQLIIGALNGF